MYEYLKRVIATVNNISTIYVQSWTGEGLSNEQIKSPNTSTNNDQGLILEYDAREISLKFSADLLKQNRVTYNHGPKVSIFIVYKLNTHTINTAVALKDCLFGSVKITKDKDLIIMFAVDLRKTLDSKSTFTHSSSINAHNVIIIGVESSQSIHNGNRLAGNAFILGKDLI